VARPYLQCHHRFKNGKDHCSWSIAEKVRTRRGWVQRHLLYLGEINDSQKAAWTKVTEVFDTERDQTRPLALYPADRTVPAHAAEYGVQVRLNEFVLRRPRQWGACWVGCQLWEQLQLEQFWRERLVDSREGNARRALSNDRWTRVGVLSLHPAGEGSEDVAGAFELGTAAPVPAENHSERPTAQRLTLVQTFWA